MFKTLKGGAGGLRRNAFILYLAYKDPRMPWYAKAFTICVVAYAFSPIDLIPDFIPVLGLLDDVIIVPLGISLALKMIPEQVRLDVTAEAENRRRERKPKFWIAGVLIIIIWIIVAVSVIQFISR